MSASPCPNLYSCSFLLLLLLTVLEVWAGPPSKGGEFQTPRPGLSSLPAQAKTSISAALGRGQQPYRARAEGSAIRLDNPRHRLGVRFTSGGVQMQSGAGRFGVRLTGLGRGGRVEAVAAAVPKAQANRVEYRRGGLTEWYLNGPLGLEQGFTLDSPPARKGGEALTLALRLSGDLSAVPDPRGDGLALQAGGGTVLRYRGLLAWDRAGRTLPAWWQGQGREIRLRVDDGGAHYPLTIDPIIEDARLTASDGGASDSFGEAVAVDGDTVIVGAFSDDVGSGTSQGSAYVFVRPVGGWSGLLRESAKLIASDGAPGDHFGHSAVAVNGDTVVVGAHFDDIGRNFSQGSAYVFVQPPAGWAGLLTENAKLTASDGGSGDTLGDSVGVSGDTVAVYAVGADVGGNRDQGAVYVYMMPPGGWAGPLTENAKLLASDGVAGDFGFLDDALGVGGDTVVVGAPGDDVGPQSNRGSAYVYVRPPGGWTGLLTESARLAASDGTANDSFGRSVAVSGDTVVIGASTAGRPPVYVYVEPPGGWAGTLLENARLTGASGFSVAVSGEVVVTGRSVFKEPPDGWVGAVAESAQLSGAGSVAVSGDTVVAGFCGGSTTQETACVFEGLAEAEPASTRIACKTVGCRIPITCNLAQNCINRIRLLVRARDIRNNGEARAKAPRMIRLAAALANVPPGATRPVKLKLTKPGRDLVSEKKKRRLKGIIEIRNTAGTAVDRTPITIRLR